jgi:hypothetical protein
MRPAENILQAFYWSFFLTGNPVSEGKTVNNARMIGFSTNVNRYRN